MYKTIYITDLDGTLLNSKGILSEYTKNTINELIDKGLNFSYATARAYVTAKKVTNGIRINKPIIVYNGVFILDPKTEQNLYGDFGFFKLDERQAVIDFLISNDIYPLVYAFIDGKECVSWVKGKENEGINNYLSTRKGDKRLRTANDYADLFKGDIFYFTTIGSKAKLIPAYEAFKDDSRFTVHFQPYIYCADEYWCEILPKGATKANAIKQLKQMLGYEKVICFGDGGNDIEMFRSADECYAVANAVDELKKIATGIIDSNDNDGVAKWLEKNVFRSREI